MANDDPCAPNNAPPPRSRMPSPVGVRVRLIYHNDQHSSLPPGTLGTITFVDDMQTVHVAWDDGSRLGLIPGVDRWERV